MYIYVSDWWVRGEGGGAVYRAGGVLGKHLQTAKSTAANAPLPPQALHPYCGQLTEFQQKSIFISFCPQPQNMAINSSFQHSGKQIGTLTSEWLEEALLPVPPGLAGGSASVPIQRQSLCFIIQHDSMGLERRTQMGATNARCQPLALSLCLSSLYMHKYICTPSNIDSLCSLWQAQAVCFCGLMSPLYLSVITLELSDPKTKREPVVCASTVG